jgi:DNA-binding MarR family transcriptional regulator
MLWAVAGSSEEVSMAKADRGATMSRLHSAARLSRTALAARLLNHGFYAGQDQIMLALDHEDGQTPGQLAGRLGVRPPTITKTINRLQVQGFLDKRPSESDARQAHIFLTDSGRDAIRAIEKSVRKTEKQALKGLDKKEQKALSKLLSRVEANLSNGLAIEVDDEIEAEE